jgi:DNA-binding MarR family transcriptional regulator
LAEQDAGSGLLPSQRQLAVYPDTDLMITSQVVRTLERRGLLSRTADAAGDGRIKRLAVTNAGRDLAVRALDVVETADAGFFDRFPDRDRLLAVLQQLADVPTGSRPSR